MLLLGVGFICVVSSLTSAAVNAVPINLTGMASGATSRLVREFGQALDPAVISTVAMRAASSVLVGKLSGADAGMEAAAGPLAVVNAGSNSAKAAPPTDLGHGVVICGCASLLGALGRCCWSARTPHARQWARARRRCRQRRREGSGGGGRGP